jgi:hypothetical protein
LPAIAGRDCGVSGTEEDSELSIDKISGTLALAARAGVLVLAAFSALICAAEKKKKQMVKWNTKGSSGIEERWNEHGAIVTLAFALFETKITNECGASIAVH